MKTYRQFITEVTAAGEEARKLGLKHVGRGMYASKSGEITHRSLGGKKLEKVKPKDAPQQAQSTKGTDETPTKGKTASATPQQELEPNAEMPGVDQPAGVTVTFGRFNPPTIGHEKLIQSVASMAKGGEFRIYPSRSQDKNKNPLTPTEKISVMKKMFPEYKDNIINDENMRTIIDVLKSCGEEGFTDVTIVVGGDRVSEFEELANKYNGSIYTFNTINVLSAGSRDPDAESVEGMSASKMRAAASQNDFKSFRSGVPKSLNDKQAMNLMNKLRKSMGVSSMSPKVELWQIAPKLDYVNLRENYYQGNIFQLGSVVENLNTGITGKVVNRGTNYVLYVDENDVQYRGWLKDLVEGEDPSTQLEVGTDRYRSYVQSLTPGQSVTNFYDLNKKLKSINNKRR